ncbi:YgfZ/GcvT domain-containing protein [Pelagibacterium sp.]|uniref:CAF17-like 4Fe-4S cluster assembly/insertion protein YgfZ n=1 Tax=Pelagibacterium sp. TaxID=1967288 RepID=UPI003A94B9FB
MTIEKRVDRVAFKISGPDATHLMHDVLTPPVLEDGKARWFALLAPQGKILAEGLIGWAEDAHWLDVPAAVAENFFKRMKMYRLRAKIDIEPLAETHRVGWSAQSPTSGIAHPDSRAELLGYRVIAPLADAAAWVVGTGQAEARINAGIAEMGPDFDGEDAFPHDIGMDHLGGVDFKKGCYVGQEVVSRMQHRGTARRRPVIVSGLTTGKRGDAVMIGGKSVGTIGTVVEGKAVAIARIDKITAPGAASIGETPVSLALPDWARYDFATPGGDSKDD